jgi:antitoxin (DNA-binding transcriptional repressor) of toxin-antitoxin stability system
MKGTARRLNASRLRADIYRVLDRVLESGVPIEVERHGRIIKIVPDKPTAKLDRLVRRPRFFKCDPDEIVHMDWSKYWRPGRV